MLSEQKGFLTAGIAVDEGQVDVAFRSSKDAGPLRQMRVSEQGLFEWITSRARDNHIFIVSAAFGPHICPVTERLTEAGARVHLHCPFLGACNRAKGYADLTRCQRALSWLERGGDLEGRYRCGFRLLPARGLI